MPASSTEASFEEAFAQARREVGGGGISEALKNGPLGSLFKYATNGVITGDAIRRELREEQAVFQRQFAAALSKAGVDTAHPIDLQIDSQGMIVVAGTHPDKAKIEALFANDQAMAERFKKIGSFSRLLKAGEEAVEFQAAYRRDPEKAVAQYSHLFDSEWMGEFTMRVKTGDLAGALSFEILWQKLGLGGQGCLSST
ncbi:MAG TPA: hypothetical protein V6D00_11815 [Pantanalinema sp.]